MCVEVCRVEGVCVGVCREGGCVCVEVCRGEGWVHVEACKGVGENVRIIVLICDVLTVSLIQKQSSVAAVLFNIT